MCGASGGSPVSIGRARARRMVNAAARQPPRRWGWRRAVYAQLCAFPVAGCLYWPCSYCGSCPLATLARREARGSMPGPYPSPAVAGEGWGRELAMGSFSCAFGGAPRDLPAGLGHLRYWCAPKCCVIQLGCRCYGVGAYSWCGWAAGAGHGDWTAKWGCDYAGWAGTEWSTVARLAGPWG